MNERGIIGYYNILVILFLTFSLTVSVLKNVNRYRTDVYQYELLTSIQELEDTLHSALHDIAQRSKVTSMFTDKYGNTYYIETIDRNNNIYLVERFDRNILRSSMAVLHITVKFNNGQYEILEWEYTISE